MVSTCPSLPAKPRPAQAEAAKPVDPWRMRLERVRGTVGFDGLERISTQTLMEIAEVPQRQRAAGNYRHLASLMAELGWTAVRVRDFNRRGFNEQVRGYLREGARPLITFAFCAAAAMSNRRCDTPATVGRIVRFTAVTTIAVDLTAYVGRLRFSCTTSTEDRHDALPKKTAGTLHPRPPS